MDIVLLFKESQSLIKNLQFLLFNQEIRENHDLQDLQLNSTDRIITSLKAKDI